MLWSGMRGKVPSLTVRASVGKKTDSPVGGACGYGVLGFGARGVPILGVACFVTKRGGTLFVHVLATVFLLGKDVVHATKARFEVASLLAQRRSLVARHMLSLFLVLGDGLKKHLCARCQMASPFY